MKFSLVRVTIVLVACSMLLVGVREARAQAPDSSLLKAGIEALKSKSAEKRAQGAQTLGFLGPNGAAGVPALVTALKDSDADVRSAAADALGKIGAQPAIAVPALIDAFAEQVTENQVHYVKALAPYIEKNPSGILSKIRATLKDGSRRFGAVLALMSMGKAALPAQADVLALMDDPTPSVRVISAEALGAIGPPWEKTIPALIKALKDTDAEVRLAAADALSNIGSAASAAVPALITALKDKDETVRTNAALALSKMPAKAVVAIPDLVEALKDSERKVRGNAEEALGQIGVPAAPELPLLIAALKDSSLFVCKASAVNIKRIAEALEAQKKTLSVAVLQKAITDLETALHAFPEVPKKDEMQDTLKEAEPAISEAQFQLKEEMKSRSPQAAATVPETTPARHDLAEARRLIKQAEQEAAKITEKESRVSALEDVAMAKARSGDYEGARLMARALGTNDSKAKILKEMAVQKVKEGDYNDGVKIVEGIASGHDKISAYSPMVDALIGLKKEGVAATVIEYARLVKLSDDFDGLFDQISIGRALARVGDPEKTSAMASALKGGTPLQNDFKALLFVIAKAYNHDIPGARTKLAEVHTDAAPFLGLIEIAEAQLKAGDKAGAAVTCKQFIERVQSASSPAGGIVILARLQFDNGDSVGARTTMQAALEAAAKKPDETELADVAMQQAEIEDVEGALKTMAQIKMASNQVAARKSIAAFRAKSGDVTAALAMTPPNADAFCKAEVLVGTAQGILESLKSLPQAVTGQL